jgi:hypothetical protein
MAITINGSGTVTGISAGGLPDAIITTAEVADLNITPAKMSQKLTSGTSVASTSGTSITFNSIPSWVKRITVMFSGVSTNGTSILLVQLGDSGGVENTGYIGAGSGFITGSGTAVVTQTTGFGMSYVNTAAGILYSTVVLNLLSSNLWVANGNGYFTGTAASIFTAGTKELSATLDRVRITTVNGTDTFDAGSINILYEG